jgi:predicted nucleic acid-binding protein
LRSPSRRRLRQPPAIEIVGERHAELFESLCRRHALRGNGVYDAHLAALALERGATLVTRDRGFARFADLATFDPVAVAGLHEPPAPYAAKRRRVSRPARS